MKTIVILIILLAFWLLIRGAIIPSKKERNSTRRCSWCGSVIPFTARVCPYCKRDPGHDFSAENKVYGSQFLKSFKWCFILVAIVLILHILKEYVGIDILGMFGIEFG